MNNVVVKTLIFIAGGVIGFLTARTVYTKHYEKRIEEEILSVKDAYNDALNKMLNEDKAELKAKKEENREHKTMENTKVPRQRTNNISVIIDGSNEYNQTKQYYNVTSENENGIPSLEFSTNHEYYDDEEIDEQYINDTAYGEPVEEVINPIPYIIDEHSFTQDFDHHDKVSLDFYTVDAVLVDEIDKKIGRVTVLEMIGADAYNILCNVKVDTIIHVRNEKLRIDYEIGTVNDSYEETKEYEEEQRVVRKNITPREAFDLRQKNGGE